MVPPAIPTYRNIRQIKLQRADSRERCSSNELDVIGNACEEGTILRRRVNLAFLLEIRTYIFEPKFARRTPLVPVPVTSPKHHFQVIPRVIHGQILKARPTWGDDSQALESRKGGAHESQGVD